MKWVGVLPFVYKPYLDECKATMHPNFLENVLFIDNTVDNVGIMKAHNMGVDFMKERDADFLIIISAAVRFGKNGGLDFIDQLAAHADYHVIHAASENVVGGKQANPDGGGGQNKVFGWHLTAFNKEVFDTIGYWDENFSPYGLDDIDMSLRIRKGFKENTKWDTYPCDVSDTTMSHSINKAGIKSAYPPREMYFERKWGRKGGDWQNNGYEHPFNNSANSLSYWPIPSDPLSIHNVEYANTDWTYND